jgi:hypothetical protein
MKTMLLPMLKLQTNYGFRRLLFAKKTRILLLSESFTVAIGLQNGQTGWSRPTKTPKAQRMFVIVHFINIG